MRNRKCTVYKLKEGVGEISVYSNWMMIGYPIEGSAEMQYHCHRFNQDNVTQYVLTEILSAFFLFHDIFIDETGREYFMEDVAKEISSQLVV